MIRLDRSDQDARVSFGPAYALGDPRFLAAFLLASEVTNTGSTTLCFIKLEGYKSKDAGGAILMTPMFVPYVDGSVIDLGNGLWTDTCVRPQETGWLLDIELSMDPNAQLYDALDSVEFAVTVDETATGILPNARVVPTGYHVTPARAVVVDFLNEGPGSAQIGQTDLMRYIALDDAGAPVFWTFLTKAVNPQGLLKVGATGTAEEDVFFSGTAHRMRAMLSYHSPDFGTALLRRALTGTVDTMAETRARYLTHRLEMVEELRRTWRER
jgi:hypothetical protein